jgi:hypothetical protein
MTFRHLINMVNPDQKIKVAAEIVLRMVEKVVTLKGLDRQHHRDEVEKYFSFLLQYKDLLDVYDIRKAGISDAEWQLAKENFFKLRKEKEPT